MAKINKMHYYTSTGEKKVNRYYVTLPKKIVEQTNLQDSEIEIKIVGNAIVIEKKYN